jgi:prophage regulatory protein
VEKRRLLSPRQTKVEHTSLSERHMARLAGKGKFPRPVRLGEGKNARTAYVEDEVLAWNAERIAERDAGIKPGAPTRSATAEIPEPIAAPSQRRHR